MSLCRLADMVRTGGEGKRREREKERGGGGSQEGRDRK